MFMFLYSARKKRSKVGLHLTDATTQKETFGSVGYTSPALAEL